MLPNSTLHSPHTILPNSGHPIRHLLESELHHRPRPDYLSRLLLGHVDPGVRLNAVNWIIKASGRHGFRPATTCLAVNYLDRFLSCNCVITEKSEWPWQLLAVACLSVGAKLEEIHVPLLVDLQLEVEECSTFIFDPQTVQNMELLLMTTLDWRLRAVTPFDFLHCFVNEKTYLFDYASKLILDIFKVAESVGISPSTIAITTLIWSKMDDFSAHECMKLSLLKEIVGKEKIEECSKLMEKYLIGVGFDACFSQPFSLTSPESPTVVAESLVPRGKRRRLSFSGCA